LSDFLAALGVLLAAAASAGTILLPAGRARSLAMLAALVLFPLLILGDQWHSQQIVDLRDHTSRLVALGALALVATAVLAYVFRRWPTLLRYILAGFVLLYALQALYSPDFSKGLQNVCFFLVPFSLVYGLLRGVSWDKRLLTLVLWVVAIEAVCFVVVGTVEHFSRSLFWNDQVIRSNEFHTYFRVNSVFWDPNIYGRYLALVAVVAMSALLWARERRDLALLTALVFVLWLGLVPTFSQSSFAALIAGLAVLAALRWSLKWTAIVVAILIVAGAATFNPGRINIDTSGRANLVSGGIHLFAQRPVYGYGSGSFPKAYREHVETHKAPVSVSHTEPITVAAEQGLVGLVAYVALVVAALWTMAAGLLRHPSVARAAVLATFVALLVHTMAYAGFFEDPITWVLLAVGASLAAAARRRVSECPDTSAA
jgi:putative inorganic carbon (HCO3(-)) transporter